MRGLLMRRVKLRQTCWLATGRWYLIDRIVWSGLKQYQSFAVPRTATWNCRVAQRLNGPARDLNFFQLATSKKSNKAIVRRPEWQRCFFGSRQRLGSDRVKWSDPQDT